MLVRSARPLSNLAPSLGARAISFSSSSPSRDATATPPKPPPLANTLSDVPPDAYRPPGSAVSIRKPLNFTPAVQRWSAVLPDQLVVGTFGVQTLIPDAINGGSFMRWAEAALHPTPSSPTSSSSSFAPVAADHARYIDSSGYTHHVIVAYWREPETYARWAAAQEGWWSAAVERDEGVYREVVSVPRDYAETIYWLDYPGGIMRDTGTQLSPTPYCGYYGAMRDRLGCAADDTLEPTPQAQAASEPRPEQSLDKGKGRWRVTLPRNVAVIRSAHTWEYMDGEQRADYEAKLRPPLRKGMDFLATTPTSGCLSLRWLTGANADGSARPEAHATAYFASLGHMEAWAERHKTHAAIFGAAVARYNTTGARTS